MSIALVQVREEMKRLVDSKPEGFGYKDVAPGWEPDQGSRSMCRYLINSMPACIVGQVAFDLGTPVARIRWWEGDDAFHISGFDQDAREYLQTAQTVQDKGFTWALAYQAAELSLILGTRTSNGDWSR